MSMCTLRSLAVLSVLLILEVPRCSMALPKSWVQGVHPKEESAPEIDHSAAAAAAQDLMDQLDTSDEVEESMHNLETPALKTRAYNPVDPPYGQDPKPYNPNPEPYNPDPKPYGQDPTYDKDPHCRTYYDYVYDKKCKDYKDPHCRTYYDYVYDKKCK